MAIRAVELVKSYGRRRVVDGVSLEVNKGEVVGLLGPNGAGKTTTFYMIVGLERPTSGRIYKDNTDLTGLPLHKRSVSGIGYLAQEPSIFRKLTVRENIMAILELRKMSQTERVAKCDQLLEEFRVADLANQAGYVLSGGERRRVEIARALASDPEFILLDEPFTGVDPIAVYDIQQIIRDLKEQGYGILITDHSVRETLSITDRAYIMHLGKVLVSGTADEITQNEIARKFYLGDRFSL